MNPAEPGLDAGSDDDDAAPDLPAGTRNYITPAGLARLQAERRQLWRIDRPEVVRVVEWAAGNGDRSENGDYIYGKRRLREIDRRLRFLDKRIEAAEAVDPARQTHRDRVYFGATVTYARISHTGRGHAGVNNIEAADGDVTVTIVGIDETDGGPNRISWVSPVARALLKSGVGDVVTLQTPAGPESLEVTAISYPSA